MCVQMIHELMHLYQLMYHPYQTTLYQYSYFNRLLLLFSARFQIKATIIVIITAIIKRITSNGHTGIPNGIKITVSSITVIFIPLAIPVWPLLVIHFMISVI